jgi:hypothetical protein
MPILYESRRKKIQRFLVLSSLQKGFGKFNLLAYHQRDYRFSKVKESWCIITNLSDPNEVIKLYKKRAGIEAMFRDYKSGGYKLEGSKANVLRLTNLILLIATAYTSACLLGKSFKNQRHQKVRIQVWRRGMREGIVRSQEWAEIALWKKVIAERA